MKAILLFAWFCLAYGQNWDAVIELTNYDDFFSPGPKTGFDSLAFSPDGTKLASGGRDHTVQLWNAFTGDLLTTMSGHGLAVMAVAFSPDGTKLASGSSDHNIKVWNIPSGNLITTIGGHQKGVLSVAISPDGTKLVSSSRDYDIKIWNFPAGDLIKHLDLHSHVAVSLAISPDGTKLMSVGGRFGKLWSFPHATKPIKDYETQYDSNDHDNYESFMSVAFHPDGTKFATGTFTSHYNTGIFRLGSWSEGIIKLYNIESGFFGHLIKTMHGHTQQVDSLAFSSDGTRLVSGSTDGNAIIWNPFSGGLFSSYDRITTKRVGPVTAVAISPNGKNMAACAGSGGLISVWGGSPGGEFLSASTKLAYFSYFTGTIFLANVLLVAL